MTDEPEKLSDEDVESTPDAEAPRSGGTETHGDDETTRGASTPEADSTPGDASDEPAPEPERAEEAPARAPRRRRRKARAEQPAEPVAEETVEPAVEEDAATPEPVAETGDEEPEAEEREGEEEEESEAEADEDELEEEAGELAVAPRPARRRRGERDPDAPAPVVRAQAKYVRSSARKARLVCDNIRGKSVDEARAILALTPRAIARDWSKLLESAVANAEHNHELVGEDLYVKAVHADEGPTIKRFRPRAMGRATQIRKRTSHLTIQLTPKD
jgi:ribosomal protein L22